MKLDLQLFSEDIEGSAIDTGDVIENQTESMSDYEQFESLYYGSEEESDGYEEVDVEVASNDAELSASTDVSEQPWKTEQNARFAAERRKQEEEQRIAQAVQSARDSVYAEQYKDTVNPYTGQPIRSEADYKQYVQQYNEDLIKSSGIQQSQFDQIVNSDPRIQQAQQIINQQNAMQKQSAMEQESLKLKEAVKKIGQFDKSVKTEQDVINNPHFQQIAEYYNKGISLEDAYYLANRAELEAKKQAATRQQTINQVAGKQHMKTTGQNGVGNDVHIPADVMSMYREMTGMSDDAIRKHYSRINAK